MENNNNFDLQERQMYALLNIIKFQRRIEDKNDDYFVHDNQLETARRILYEIYYNDTRHFHVCAQPQGGKTAGVLSVGYMIHRNEDLNDRLKIGENGLNVFLVTSLAFTENNRQHVIDMQTLISSKINFNVINLGRMTKLLRGENLNADDKRVIRNIQQNALIFFDESHLGASEKQKLNAFVDKIWGVTLAGGQKMMRKRNIITISISATGFSEINSLQNPSIKKHLIVHQPGEKYFGVQDLFNGGKIFDAFDLKTSDGRKELAGKIARHKTNGYIIVRYKGNERSKVESEIRTKCKNVTFINYTQEEELEDINTVLDVKPTNKTVIFLKEKLRAGIRVNTKNLLIWHDSFRSRTDTVTQSVGRCFGYGKNRNVEVYCDVESLRKYKILVDHNFAVDKMPEGKDNAKVPRDTKSEFIQEKKGIILFDRVKNEMQDIADIISWKGNRSSTQKKRVIDFYLSNLDRKKLDAEQVALIEHCETVGYIPASFNRVDPSHSTYFDKDGYLTTGDVYEYNKPEHVGKIVVGISRFENIPEKEGKLEFAITQIVRNPHFGSKEIVTAITKNSGYYPKRPVEN